MKEQKDDEEIEEDDQEVNLDKIEEEMEAYYSSEGEDNDMVWVPGAAGATAPAQGERSAVSLTLERAHEINMKCIQSNKHSYSPGRSKDSAV